MSTRLLTDCAFVPLASAEDALRLRQDRELMGMSRLTQLNGAMYAGEIRRIREKIDSVLMLLESGLAVRVNRVVS